jgi:hypothetical protein
MPDEEFEGLSIPEKIAHLDRVLRVLTASQTAPVADTSFSNPNVGDSQAHKAD